MAKNDRDLFTRLRNVGLRKQAAKTLSGIGDGAGKKAIKAARSAVSELRSLADDIESRLPTLPGTAPRARAARTTRSRRTATRAAAAKPAARKPAARTSTARTSTARRTTTARTANSSRAGTRAPRGANKAKILASLRSGPKTASEIAKETGIGVGTVGSTLTKMAGSGEVQKAARGYGLPR